MTTRRRRLPLPRLWQLLGLTVLALGLLAANVPRSSGHVVEIVVPRGASERIARGEPVVVMPARLELKVGDTLRIDNQDVAAQTVGPYVVEPGEVVEVTYGAPGTYQGSCLLSEGEGYEIVVSQ